MSLRKKTLLIIGATLTGLFAVLMFVLSSVLSGGFEQVENNFVERNVERVRAVLDAEYANMNANVGDYAPWDDTYLFVQNELDSYIDNNVYDSVFDNLSINTMLFLTPDNEPVLQYTFDPDTYAFVDDESEALSGAILHHLVYNDFLLTHDAAESAHFGMILLEENPVIIASQPILYSDGSGFPDGGTAIMARWFDDTVVDSLEGQARVDIELRRLDQVETITGDFAEALAKLYEGEDPYIAPLGSDASCRIEEDASTEDCIAGYTLLSDVYGRDTMLMRVAIPRDVTAQGQGTLKVFIGALVAVGLVFTILTLIILERLVLSPIHKLSTGVQYIGGSGDLSTRLDVVGSDELSALSEEINTMLQNLQDSLAREKVLKAEVKQLRIEIDRVKQNQQVSEITDTDYFRDLQSKAKDLRERKKIPVIAGKPRSVLRQNWELPTNRKKNLIQKRRSLVG